tara:strand:+ start:514 stop:1242 length:729 start_codon:yes stop_codon:yes gene_type:complete
VGVNETAKLALLLRSISSNTICSGFISQSAISFKVALLRRKQMTMQLYELSSKNDCRFSPYCWRTRLALKHKQLTYEIIHIRFSDKAAVAFYSQERFPVLRDGDKVISDSWNIALYLESNYPNKPNLFNGHAGRSLTNFLNGWVDQILHPSLIPIIIADILNNVDPIYENYFIESRMARFGKHPKEMQNRNTANMQNFENAARALRASLKNKPFLTGDRPAYADYIVFGAFVWYTLLAILTY